MDSMSDRATTATDDRTRTGGTHRATTRRRPFRRTPRTAGRAASSGRAARVDRSAEGSVSGFLLWAFLALVGGYVAFLIGEAITLTVLVK
jgi:hypothetical protein